MATSDAPTSSGPTATGHEEEHTFRNFTPEQAALYASFRSSTYSPILLSAVTAHLSSSHNLLVDIGTGPGKALFGLLPQFTRAIGLDASSAMIAQATSTAESLGLGDRASFAVARAVEICSALSPADEGNVDLITAAVAAHWFDLPRFWAEAGRALRPGGVVALWTFSGVFCHPSDPDCRRIQEVLDSVNAKDKLGPYMAKGNRLARERYRDLLMPWDVEGLDDWEPECKRVEWDVDGVPSAEDGAFLKGEMIDIDTWEKGMGSVSPVARWREAHPELVGTERDVVREVVDNMKKVLGDRRAFVSGSTTTLLLFRKASKAPIAA